MNSNERKNEGRDLAILEEVGRQAYEGSVMYRMQGRSGAYAPTGSHGIAFEVMANDKENLKNLLKPDTVVKPTKSPTAKQVDAVKMVGNVPRERIQYKDTTSPAGIRKTLNQVENGKYTQAQLRGTTETAELYSKMASEKGITKEMTSTGISSKTTKRVGDKFTGQVPRLDSVGNAVKTSAGAAVAFTAGTEILKSAINGETLSECASNVVSKSAESAVAATAATLAGEGALWLATTTLSTVATPAVVPLLAAGGAAFAAGAVAGNLVEGVFDDIGEGIGNFVEDVGDAVGCALINIECFLGSLFW